MEDSLIRLAYLHNLWCTQQLTEEESREYFDLLEKQGVEAALEPFIKSSWAVAQDEGDFGITDRYRLAGNILAKPPQQQTPVIQSVSLTRFIRQWPWAAAAAVTLLLATGVYFGVYRPPHTNVIAKSSLLPAADKAPGEDGAILTLADGSHVVLDSLKDGVIAKQNGVNAVIKNGSLTYQVSSSNAPHGEMVYNTVSTPRGRQFQLLLPDGTKVWLNAATAIKYPTVFPEHERNVEVTGEAYFEVAKDKAKPFRVHFSTEGGRQGTVLALGTSFNVSAYYDDPAAKVTLLEGKVLVSPSPVENQDGILIPGQQASIFYGKPQSAGMTVQNVDTSKVIAWKNGILNLHNMGLAEVMKQLSRWYSIDIVYEDSIPDITFWGEINRSENLSTVLSFMAQSGVNFEIGDGGKKIIVKK